MNKNKICGIYKIDNISNDHCYIGSSVQIGIRFQQHKLRLRKGTHHSVYLQRAWDRYGKDSFVFSIIEECAKEDIVEREQHYLDTIRPQYNIAIKANKPPIDPERSRKTMKRLWAEGRLEHRKKAVERIDPNTGEIKEYESATEAEQDGFMQQSVSACCAGIKASYANYYWQYIDGSTPESNTSYEKIFRNVIGSNTKKGDKVELSSFDQCHSAGFNYGKIRECCSGKRGRRTHKSYSWVYADEFNQSVAEGDKHRTFADAFYKAVVRTDPVTLDEVRYESQAAAKADGFDQRKVSMCCLGKRKTHGGYQWSFAL